MLKYSDIPMMKSFIEAKRERIEELEKLEPTAERLAEINRITLEAKILKRDIKILKGNMYPYAT